MEITFFGIILILLFLIFLFKNRNSSFKEIYCKLFFFSIASSLVIDLGYFMKIGNFIIEYNYVFTLITLVFAIISIFIYHISINRYSFVFLIFCVLIMGVLLPTLFNILYKSVSFDEPWDIYIGTGVPLNDVRVTSHSIFLIIRVVFFLIEFITFCSLRGENNISFYMNKLFKISAFVLFLSLIEMFVSNFIHPMYFREFSFRLFGRSNASYYVPRQAFGIYVPMLFMREPSSFCYTSLFFIINGIALYNDSNSKILKRKTIIVCLLYIILLALSKSLSAYIYILSIFLVVFYISRNKALIFLSSITIIGFVICILLSTMGDRINVLLSSLSSILSNEYNNLSNSSEVIRIYSIYNNFMLFLNYPIIGCGIGTIYSYSAVVTVLCNIGIIGILLFIIVIKKNTNYFFNVEFFSWFSLNIIIVNHLFTGHMSHLLYLERISYLYLLLKYINIQNNSKKHIFSDKTKKGVAYEI